MSTQKCPGVIWELDICFWHCTWTVNDSSAAVIFSTVEGRVDLMYDFLIISATLSYPLRTDVIVSVE